MSIFRKTIKNKDGITVLEILLAVLIALTIFGVAYSLQIFGLRSFFLGTQTADLQQKARLIDQIIRNELRNAQPLKFTTFDNAKALWLGSDDLFYYDNNKSVNVAGIDWVKIKTKVVSEGDNPRFMLEYEIKGGSQVEYSNQILLNNIMDLADIEIDEILVTVNQKLYYKLP